MPLGQFTPGQTLVVAPMTFDTTTSFNRGVKAGTGWGTPTIAAFTNAGGGAAISGQRGTDFAGSFILTAGTTPSAGTVATVVFANQLAAVPTSVVVNVQNQTTALALVGAPGSIAVTGFGIVTSAINALSNVVNISYVVIQ